MSAKETDPSEGFLSVPGTPLHGKGIRTMKASKLRVAPAGLFAAVGLSLLESLAAPIASADPWVPGSGPLHPIRHYAADITHPIWLSRTLCVQ